MNVQNHVWRPTWLTVLLLGAGGALSESAAVEPTSGNGFQHLVTPTFETPTLAPYSGLGSLELAAEADRPDPVPFPWPDRQPHPWLARFHFDHPDPNDPQRHVGIGEPLQGTSWRNRPFHVGWIAGGLFGGAISGQVEQSGNLFGGYQVGWDFDHYWGTELRFAFANLELISPNQDALGTGRNHYWDVSLLYYPWGDAAWRPFVSYGLGVGSFRYRGDDRVSREDVSFSMPLSGGVKYFYRPWLAWRLSVTDNLSLGGHDLATMHNVSVATGVEVHVGGRRPSYFPYHPGGYLW